jgi:hypothetical protein
MSIAALTASNTADVGSPNRSAPADFYSARRFIIFLHPMSKNFQPTEAIIGKFLGGQRIKDFL